jgi:hypothetical protein
MFDGIALRSRVVEARRRHVLRQVFRPRLALASLFLVMTLWPGCRSAPPSCGTFAFTGAAHNDRGVEVELDFPFDPGACGAACTCNTVAFVQLMRAIDLETGEFLAPNSEQQNRLVTGQATDTMNGWAVDRTHGKIWGYYGRNNDGSFAGIVTTGSNNAAATLRDFPRGWWDNTWFEAFSVPVCIDAAATCRDRLLGFRHWVFVVDGNGMAGDPLDGPGPDWAPTAVELSVTEWNNDAAALQKNSLPAMTVLP